MKLLVFSSVICRPCHMMAPLVEAVTKEQGVQTLKYIAGVNSTEFREWNVTSVPTLIVVDDKGLEIRRQVGLIPKPQLTKFIGG